MFPEKPTKVAENAYASTHTHSSNNCPSIQYVNAKNKTRASQLGSQIILSKEKYTYHKTKHKIHSVSPEKPTKITVNAYLSPQSMQWLNGVMSSSRTRDASTHHTCNKPKAGGKWCHGQQIPTQIPPPPRHRLPATVCAFSSL